MVWMKKFWNSIVGCIVRLTYLQILKAIALDKDKVIILCTTATTNGYLFFWSSRQYYFTYPESSGWCLKEVSIVHRSSVFHNCILERSSQMPLINKLIQCFSLSGLMKFLGKGTTGRIIEDGDDKRDKMLRVFRDNLQNKYNRYAFIFFACEVLNLIVVISQFLITNIFLEYQFTWYGPTVWRWVVPLDDYIIFCEMFLRIRRLLYLINGWNMF